MLEQYSGYQAELRDLHSRLRPKSRFLERIGHSQTWLNTYLKGANLQWPLLPEDDALLVAVVWGLPPYHVTWASKSLYELLGYSRDEFINSVSALQLLHGNRELDAFERHAIQQVRREPPFISSIDRVNLIHRDGHEIPIALEVRYTGAIHQRFYCQARVLQASTDSTFNVEPDLVLRPSRLTPEQLHDMFVKTENHFIASIEMARRTGRLRELIDQNIGTYRYPSQESPA